MKKIKSFLLAGNQADSYYKEIVQGSKQGYRYNISNYMVLFKEDINSEEYVYASEKTEHSFFIVTSHKKTEAIVRFNHETYALNDIDVDKHMKPFRGELFLIWWDEKTQDMYRFVYIDSMKGKHKSICIDTHGYDEKDISLVIHKLVSVLATPINNTEGRNNDNALQLKMPTVIKDYSEGEEV